MKTQVDAEKTEFSASQTDSIVCPCLARARLLRFTMYLTRFIDFSVIPLPPVH